MNFNFLDNFSPEIATMIWAILPIAEIRVSIPVALKIYKMSIFSALFWSLLGNLSITFVLLIAIEPISRFLSERSTLFKRLFEWLFRRTRKKFYKKYDKYGDLAIFLFVAIPMPTTGCWTGAIASWLFGIRTKKAFFLISAGILVSSIIIVLLTVGILHPFNY